MEIVKPIYVSFGEKKLEIEFEGLEQGKFEDKKLFEFIKRAKDDLKKNPACGIKIPRKLWPEKYIREYSINNLWKYDLPDGWRLIYTIQVNDLMILNIILEWFDHKSYEKRFGY